MLGVGQAGPTGMLAAAAEPRRRAAGADARCDRGRADRAPGVGGPGVGVGPRAGRVRGAAATVRVGARDPRDGAAGPGAERRLVAAGVDDERETFDARRRRGDRRGRRGARSRRSGGSSCPGVDILTIEDPAYPRGCSRSSCRRTCCSSAATPRRCRRRTPWPSSGRAARRRPAARSRPGSAARSRRPGRSSCPGLAVGIDGASHAAAMAEGGRRWPSSARATAGCTREPTRSWPTGSSPTAARSSRSSSRTRTRARARSRAATGSSAAWPTRRSSSRPAPRSGALITADWALEQGRDLFIVPGPDRRRRESAGCLALAARLPGAGPDRRRASRS